MSYHKLTDKAERVLCPCWDEFKDAAVELIPLAWGMLAAFAWNLAIQATFSALGIEGSGSLILRYLWALLITFITAFFYMLIVMGVKKGMFCGADKEILKALAGLFKNAFALVCALAWNGAFLVTFCKAAKKDGGKGNEDACADLSSTQCECTETWWLIFIYAIVATIVMIFVVVLVAWIRKRFGIRQRG
eukprot:TRINITY_DN13966_c0_g1_i1.p1 TRINITY_DN13966_c0_g1~~TRINITY_DN13966_c0_g1_i1.p1  ORF type:complete len:190 (+),score=11.41 TRINITY_DN13966_c0_g1_i1:35-604(+)